MARIAGVNIPNDKRVEISLTYIYGIGKTTSNKILKLTGINKDARVKDLSEDEINKLRNQIKETIKIEGDLRREVLLNIKRLKDVKAYRGTRHSKRLPARGQRTKTNSRTVRGNKKGSASSGKKPANQKT